MPPTLDAVQTASVRMRQVSDFLQVSLPTRPQAHCCGQAAKLVPAAVPVNPASVCLTCGFVGSVSRPRGNTGRFRCVLFWLASSPYHAELAQPTYRAGGAHLEHIVIEIALHCGRWGSAIANMGIEYRVSWILRFQAQRALAQYANTGTPRTGVF